MTDDALNEAKRLAHRVGTGESSASDHLALQRLVREMVDAILAQRATIGAVHANADLLREFIREVRGARARMTPGEWDVGEYDDGPQAWVRNPACRCTHPSDPTGVPSAPCVCTLVGGLEDDRDTDGIAAEHAARPVFLDALERVLATVSK